MTRAEEDEEVYILMAPCGDAIEMWEPIPSMFMYCQNCIQWHEYLPE
jgi:hypothetical protein